jgi:hypothetical protein
MTSRLERAMLRQRTDDGWRLEGFGARGPATPWARPLRLFGRFVGDWEIFAPETGGRDRPAGPVTGEAHFAWALGGTAVVDVWGPLEPARRRLIPAGTTVRFYDPRIRAWRSTWLSPNQHEVRTFIGRAQGREIRLEERGGTGPKERWIFFDIRSRSFRWRAERRARPGGPWKVIEEYWIGRRPAAPDRPARRRSPRRRPSGGAGSRGRP